MHGWNIHCQQERGDIQCWQWDGGGGGGGGVVVEVVGRGIYEVLHVFGHFPHSFTIHPL